MKFRFRLEKVLTHRRRVEDEAKRAYFEAKAKTEAALTELEGLYRQIDDARARGHELMTGGAQDIPPRFAAPILQHTDLFIGGQKIRIETQRKKIRDLKGEEERLQDLLAEAARERKAMEKLREKHREEFVAEQDRREREEADDLSVMRFGRGEGPV